MFHSVGLSLRALLFIGLPLLSLAELHVFGLMVLTKQKNQWLGKRPNEGTPTLGHGKEVPR